MRCIVAVDLRHMFAALSGRGWPEAESRVSQRNGAKALRRPPSPRPVHVPSLHMALSVSTTCGEQGRPTE